MKTAATVSVIISYFLYFFFGCMGIYPEKLDFVQPERKNKSDIFKYPTISIYPSVNMEPYKLWEIPYAWDNGIKSSSRITNKNPPSTENNNLNKSIMFPNNSSNIHLGEEGIRIKIIAGNSRII